MLLSLTTLSLLALADASSVLLPRQATTAIGAARTANGTVETRTECKTCPYALCTNKLYYEYDTNITATCYTNGQPIFQDNTWLKTTDGCYVTPYDLIDNPGEWRNQTGYCGKASEENFVAKFPAKTKYNTECLICDSIQCDVTDYLTPGTSLELTCKDTDGYRHLDNPNWYKTTKNCYVSETGLGPLVRVAYPNCGPIPFIEAIDREGAYNGSAAPANKRKSRSKAAAATPLSAAALPIATTSLDTAIAAVPVAAAPPAPAPPARRGAAPYSKTASLLSRAANYLIALHVGEDYATCHTCQSRSCAVKKRYQYNATVTMQCYASNYTDPSINATYPGGDWSLTTDFCWVNMADIDECICDYYRFPACARFDPSLSA